MPVLARPEDRWIDVGSVRTRYWSLGERGPVVVLIHGMGASVESWLHSVHALAQDFRVECVDLIGHGRTDKPAVEYRVPLFARFVADFLAARGIAEAHLVGHSLGGAIALQLRALCPDRVRKLALITPAGFGRQLPLLLRMLNLPLLGEALSSSSRFGARRFFDLLLHDPSVVSDAEIEEFLALARLPGASQALLSTVRSNTTLRGIKPDVRASIGDLVRKTNAPTLLIWGRQDRLHLPAFADAAKLACPYFQLEWLDACGHAPPLEQPDRVNALLREFLRAS
jgi:4,5:9,10-diseco-3-hydroxy-5,9,17-trioxoandrosta-1(10),2-diene-4-oate hydrolase